MSRRRTPFLREPIATRGQDYGGGASYLGKSATPTKENE
jgi:hypothetical protein